MPAVRDDFCPPRELIFPHITVILGDPRLPDESKIGGRFSAEDIEAVDRVKEALGELQDYRFTYLDNHSTLIANLTADPPDFVLNFCDTGYKNQARQELHIPALLEMLGIPYSGAGPTCLGMCYDKSLVRSVARTHGIPVPAETFVRGNDRHGAVSQNFPVLIKPNRADGSLGITKDSLVHDEQQARAYLNKLAMEFPNWDLLIQEFLPGEEYSVGVLGNPASGFMILPILAVDYSKLVASRLPPILAYASKIDPQSPYWTDIKYCEASLKEDLRQRLVDYCLFLFERLGCRDYARFDFRTDAQGEIKLLEVNPNPAWCWDGKLNLMAGFAGYHYAELLERILHAAQVRYR
ncbi:D-alanine--D-alanine ligase domain protein [Nitrosococcus halophilus Nc 4]|uniref:D-alanine--D-alanine ligase domain protein n=1 Tax=Nitrosococcus halophilus (strain Nc4) TaxID=472759 RepID=D5C222_NITHN|nr:ATP-grasp domain-containing protein [Nitrosococcus halophilus]ADE16610.1 D-alanine--D-alanine ligase domain protein [Nitrosococcus halophilus Nc 4]